MEGDAKNGIRKMQQKEKPDGKRKKPERPVTENNIPLDKIPQPDTYGKPITQKVPVFREDSSEYEEMESALNRRGELEILVSRISREFIGLTADDIDSGISWALQQIGESPYVGCIDRCHVFLLSDDGMTIEQTHEWCAENVMESIMGAGKLPVSEFPWLIKTLSENESICVESLSSLPSEAEAERRILESQDVQSILAVPMICRGTLFGFVGLESVKEPKGWNRSDIALVKTIVDVFVSSFKRMRYEKELRIQNQFLHDVIESLGHPFYVVDANNYRIVLANSAAGSMKCLRDFRCHEGGTDYLCPAVEEVKMTGKPVMTEKSHEDESGRIRIHEIRAAPHRDNMGRIANVIVYYLDVTEQKLLEATHIESQKMESLGKLAAGIAHNFNEMLTGIGMSSGMLKLGLDGEHPGHRHLSRIDEAVGRAGKMIRRLLKFSRPTTYDSEFADMNTLIRATSSIFEIGHKSVEVQEDLDRDLWGVRVDGNQIEQVLFNLYLNAARAMSDAGQLQLKTRNVILEEKLGHLKPGMYVRVTVSDSGVGMDEKTQKRIFEPHFTTEGKRGLGLSTARGIIRNHGGHITVQSREGEGTSFDIYLPARTSGNDAEGEGPEVGKKDVA